MEATSAVAVKPAEQPMEVEASPSKPAPLAAHASPQHIAEDAAADEPADLAAPGMEPRAPAAAAAPSPSQHTKPPQPTPALPEGVLAPDALNGLLAGMQEQSGAFPRVLQARPVPETGDDSMHAGSSEQDEHTGPEIAVSGYKTENVLFNDTLLAVLVRWGLNLPGSADFESLVPDRSADDRKELAAKGIPYRRCTNCRQWGHDRRNCLLPRKDDEGNIVEFQRHCGLCGSTGHDRRTCYMNADSKDPVIGAFPATPKAMAVVGSHKLRTRRTSRQSDDFTAEDEPASEEEHFDFGNEEFLNVRRRSNERRKLKSMSLNEENTQNSADEAEPTSSGPVAFAPRPQPLSKECSYCKESKILTKPMLVCGQCHNGVHQECAFPEGDQPVLLFGDRSYTFTCRNCNNEAQQLQRHVLDWEDVVYLTVLNMVLENQGAKVEFTEDDIRIFIDKNWNSLCSGRDPASAWDKRVQKALRETNHLMALANRGPEIFGLSPSALNDESIPDEFYRFIGAAVGQAMAKNPYHTRPPKRRGRKPGTKAKPRVSVEGGVVMEGSSDEEGAGTPKRARTSTGEPRKSGRQRPKSAEIRFGEAVWAPLEIGWWPCQLTGFDKRSGWYSVIQLGDKQNIQHDVREVTRFTDAFYEHSTNPDWINKPAFIEAINAANNLVGKFQPSGDTPTGNSGRKRRERTPKISHALLEPASDDAISELSDSEEEPAVRPKKAANKRAKRKEVDMFELETLETVAACVASIAKHDQPLEHLKQTIESLRVKTEESSTEEERPELEQQLLQLARAAMDLKGLQMDAALDHAEQTIIQYFQQGDNNDASDVEDGSEKELPSDLEDLIGRWVQFYNDGKWQDGEILGVKPAASGDQYLLRHRNHRANWYELDRTEWHFIKPVPTRRRRDQLKYGHVPPKRATSAKARSSNLPVSSKAVPNEGGDDSDGVPVPGGKDVYSVERILGKRLRAGIVEYLVKWAEYPESYATWEPETNILSPELVEKFEKSQLSEPI